MTISILNLGNQGTLMYQADAVLTRYQYDNMIVEDSFSGLLFRSNLATFAAPLSCPLHLHRNLKPSGKIHMAVP